MKPRASRTEVLLTMRLLLGTAALELVFHVG